MDNRLESAFLKQFRAQGCQVAVYLRNGYGMVGKIVDFDDHVIVIETEGKQKLVYKDFVSTVRKWD
ncbi:MAG: RNA chaperone Hfq [Ruminococcaceae bacterium]|nr:RNA chaperone Hfq [Oscillospiraceae bacterium]